VLVDSKNTARLADFGFARVCIPSGLVGASASSDGGGTAAYMAPELIARHLGSDNKPTTSTLEKVPVDIFALGTLIHEVPPESSVLK
jgi:serine/threonine protein kinase